MFFQLLKDLPLMFVAAGIIWLVTIFVIVKNIRSKKQKTPSKKFITVVTVILFAIILTAVDVWLFVFFIPTHFKKDNVAQQATISTTDIAKEIQTTDSNKISSHPPTHIDSSTNKKIETTKAEEKIYSTNHASVAFLSQGEDEDIEATNHQSAIAFNSVNGNLKVVALIKGFQFDNQLMQNHFNEPAYMNSDAFPKSEFKGKITHLQQINFSSNGTYNVDVTGSLTIHGVTKNISTKGIFTVANQKISVQSIFKIKRVDFGITTNEIADELQITVKGILQ